MSDKRVYTEIRDVPTDVVVREANNKFGDGHFEWSHRHGVWGFRSITIYGTRGCWKPARTAVFGLSTAEFGPFTEV